MNFFDRNTRNPKALLAIAALFCSPMLAWGDSQEPMRITPDKAVELAIRNNLGLEAARISAETSRRASNLAWNRFVHTVDVGGSIFRLNAAPGMPPAQASQWGMAGSISATLSVNLAMFAEINRLRLDYESGLVSYGNARAQLERDIRKAYHNILLLQENIALLHGSFENAERQVQIAQANFNVGLTSELPLLQARVAKENLRPAIDQAESGRRLLMMQFAMFLGLPRNTSFELAPVAIDMAPLPLDMAELVNRAATNQPDVLVLRQDILVMNSIRQSSTRRLLTPTLSLGWSADPTFGGSPWEGGLFEQDRWSQQQGAFSVSLGFRLNGLLPFGEERQSIQALEDQIRIANIGLAQMISGTEIEIHNLVLTLERIRLSAEALEQTVALAQRSFELTEQAYRVGLADFFQVQNAEMSLRQARAQLHEQQFNYLNGLLDLEYALGFPFGALTQQGISN